MAQQAITQAVNDAQIPNPGGRGLSGGEGWMSLLAKIQANFSDLYTQVAAAAGLAVSGSRVLLTARAVNLNLVGDTVLPVVLPTGFTRFAVAGVYVSHASASLTTAQAALYTAAAAGGVNIVAAAALAGITATADATNANSLSMTVVNSLTRTFLLSGQPNLYFRNTTAQGAAATADVTIELIPLP